MKVSELEGQALDYWTAKAQGWRKARHDNPAIFCSIWNGNRTPVKEYTPSTNWQQAGELVDKYNLIIQPLLEKIHIWGASKVYDWDMNDDPMYEWVQKGPTPQIAICRAVVASVYGEEIEK